MYAFVRQFGFAIGVAISGTTLQNVMALKLEWEGLPIEISQHVESYISTLHTLPDESFKAGVVISYWYGIMGCFAVFTGVSALSLILSIFFVDQHNMNKDLRTEHTLQDLRVRRPSPQERDNGQSSSRTDTK